MNDLDRTLTAAFATARSVEPSAADIAQVLARASRHRRVRWRLGRGPTILFAGAALLVSGAAVAELFDRDEQITERVRTQGPFESSGDPALDRLIEKARTKPDLAPIADTFSIEARVPATDGGASWLLLVWRTQAAGWCSQAGRQHGETIEFLRDDGKLAPYPSFEGGSCSVGPLAPDAVSVGSTTYPGGPTAVYGVAGRDVVSITVDGVRGVRTMTPSQRGGFLAIAPEQTKIPNFTVEYELRNGSHRRIG